MIASREPNSQRFGLHEATLKLRAWIDASQPLRGLPEREQDFIAVFESVVGFNVSTVISAYAWQRSPIPLNVIMADVGIVGTPFRVLPDNECSLDVLKFRQCAFRTS